METQVKVRQANQTIDWSFSLDLTDAYPHVPMHRACTEHLGNTSDSVFGIKYSNSELFHLDQQQVLMSLLNDCNSHSFEKESNNSVSISGWLVGKKLESSNPSTRQTGYPSIDHVLGTHNQSRKIGINPCSNICVHRDGFPHSGKHCQNSCRQSSKCFRISKLVPETVICFSQSFPVPSGTTKCYCSVCDTRQIALMSTSDGFVRTVETSCSTADSQNLDFTWD